LFVIICKYVAGSIVLNFIFYLGATFYFSTGSAHVKHIGIKLTLFIVAVCVIVDLQTTSFA
jgi:hypothetical protein